MQSYLYLGLDIQCFWTNPTSTVKRTPAMFQSPSYATKTKVHLLGHHQHQHSKKMFSWNFYLE